MRIGLYPGTFDPVTRGHRDIILRAAGLVDRLVVGVAMNPGKEPLFTPQERAEMVREAIRGRGAGVDAADTADTVNTVEVMPFESLLIDFAREQGAKVIFRGLRAISDFEYEFQMAGMNRQIRPEIETVFLMCAAEHQFVSSRFVKEIARLGGDITPFVPPRVKERLQQALASGLVPHVEPRLAGTDPP